MKKNVSQRGPYILLIAPSFLFLFALTFYPLYFAVKNSFYYWNLATSPKPVSFIGLDNYINVFKFTPFLASLRNTLILAFVGVAIELFFGFLIAMALASQLKYLTYVRALLIMPVTIAPIVVGFMFRYLYWDKVGFIPWLADVFNIPEPDEGFLGSKITALGAVLLPDIWQWTPFFAIVLYASIIAVSRDLIDAAKVDGAGQIRLIWSVILPTIRPILFVIVLLQFMRLFNSFDIVYILTDGGPGDSTRTLSYGLFREGLRNFNIGVASAYTVVMVIIISLLVFIYFKLFNKRAAL